MTHFPSTSVKKNAPSAASTTAPAVVSAPPAPVASQTPAASAPKQTTPLALQAEPAAAKQPTPAVTAKVASPPLAKQAPLAALFTQQPVVAPPAKKQTPLFNFGNGASVKKNAPSAASTTTPAVVSAPPAPVASQTPAASAPKQTTPLALQAEPAAAKQPTPAATAKVAPPPLAKQAPLAALFAQQPVVAPPAKKQAPLFNFGNGAPHGAPFLPVQAQRLAAFHHHAGAANHNVGAQQVHQLVNHAAVHMGFCSSCNAVVPIHRITVAGGNPWRCPLSHFAQSPNGKSTRSIQQFPK
jgi:hypothetical protein